MRADRYFMPKSLALAADSPAGGCALAVAVAPAKRQTAMMMSDSAELRQLAIADLPTAVRLSQAAGWPHRLEDWQLAYNLADGIAAVAAGRVIGTAMSFPIDDRVARIGMVIVDPAAQGRGLGRRLMTALLAQITQPGVILAATAAGEPMYERMGFVAVGHVMQYQGTAVAAAGRSPGVTAAAAADGDAVRAIDRAATGLDRRRLLAVLGDAGEVAVLRRAGEITGYAICRRFGRGALIGPVVASNTTDAQVLADHWISRHAGSFVRIDVADPAFDEAWLQARGLAPVAPATTMLRGTNPRASGPHRLFTLANQAFG